jgi:hypothetical protein
VRTPPRRQERVEPRADLADQPCAKGQAVARRLRVSGIVAECWQEDLGLAGDHLSERRESRRLPRQRRQPRVRCMLAHPLCPHRARRPSAANGLTLQQSVAKSVQRGPRFPRLAAPALRSVMQEPRQRVRALSRREGAQSSGIRLASAIASAAGFAIFSRFGRGMPFPIQTSISWKSSSISVSELTFFSTRP